MVAAACSETDAERGERGERVGESARGSGEPWLVAMVTCGARGRSEREI